MTEQIETAAARQRKRKLGETWCRRIDEFLAIHRDALLTSGPKALLHTELMHDHLLVEPHGGGWRIGGLFDFADAFIGDGRYELPSVGLFISCGEGHLLRAFLLAYGYDESQLTEDLSQDLLAWTLCHRYCHLPWYLERMPLARHASCLEDLALRWFGL